MKSYHVRTDGTCNLYLQVYVNKERNKFPLNISVAPKDFDKIKQRIRGTHKFCKDFNLIIEEARRYK